AYVHSVLGMDDSAFRASVFAEQKQLAAFSSHTPSQRRDLVMQLLGITPLDGARDRARRDARDAAEQLNKLRAVLPDRAEVDRQLHEAEEAAAGGEIEARAALERSELARETWDAAAASHRQLLGLAQDYGRLVAEGRALRAQRDASVERLRELTAEMEALAGAEARLAELEPLASDLPGMEQRLRLTEAVAAAAEALLANPAPSPVEPPEP